MSGGIDAGNFGSLNGRSLSEGAIQDDRNLKRLLHWQKCFLESGGVTYDRRE